MQLLSVTNLASVARCIENSIGSNQVCMHRRVVRASQCNEIKKKRHSLETYYPSFVIYPKAKIALIFDFQRSHDHEFRTNFGFCTFTWKVYYHFTALQLALIIHKLNCWSTVILNNYRKRRMNQELNEFILVAKFRLIK